MRRRCIPALFLALVLLVAALASAPLSVSAATRPASKNKSKNSSKNKNSSNNKNSPKSKNKGASNTLGAKSTTITAAAAPRPPKCDENAVVCNNGSGGELYAFNCGNTQVGSALTLKCDKPDFFPCRIGTPDLLDPTKFTGTCGTVNLIAYDLGSNGVQITGTATVTGFEDPVTVTIGALMLKGGNGYCSYDDYPDGLTITETATFPRTPKYCGNVDKYNQCGLSHADVCYCIPTSLKWVEAGNEVQTAVPLCPGDPSTASSLSAVDNCGNVFPASVTIQNVTIPGGEITGISSLENIGGLSCGVYEVTYTVTHPTLSVPPKVTTYTINDWLIEQEDTLCAKKFNTHCLGETSVQRTGLEISDCKLTATYEKKTDACDREYTLTDQVVLDKACTI